MVLQVSRTPTPSSANTEIVYPETDGLPMANNTVQFDWILVIAQNLRWMFADDPNVFIAGDLFWYPKEGYNTIKQTPDVMVVIGRPKGDSPEATRCERRSYKQWEEDDIPPQVVFEILSPGNTDTEMARKLLFYDRYGVEEYYVYDPDTNQLQTWQRGEFGLDVVELDTEWTSSQLGVRFDWSGDTLIMYRPDGTPFVDYETISRALEAEQERADSEQKRADRAQAQADQEHQTRLDAVAKLIEMGLTVEQVAQALSLPIATVQVQVQAQMEGRSDMS